MSNKTNGVKWNKSSKSKQRRKSVIERLETQLKSGVKPIEAMRLSKDKSTQPLTDLDIKRINKEIETLKQRI